MGKRSPKPSVSWYLPDRKRPFAYSHPATSFFLAALADEGHTFASAFDAINYDPEAKAIVGAFIDAGYGASLMSDLGIR